MIHSDGKRTIAHRPGLYRAKKEPLTAEENANAFLRTLAEIRALPEAKS